MDAPREPIAVPRHRIRYGTRLAMAGGLLAVGAATFAVLGPMGSGRAVTQQLAPAHGPVTFTGREGAPALSPDGGRLAYVSNASATRTLMVQSLNGWPAPGEQPVPVFSAPEIGHLRWSPDGSELLVWARGPEHNGVYVLPRMGGAPRLIAAGQYVACWSPDGSTIAVGSYLNGTIWILDRLGRKQRTISLEGVHWSIYDLDWSRATNRLAVVSNDYQGHYTIWSVGPHGTDQRRMISENREIFSVRWAPDGNAVYYLRRANQADALQKVRLSPGGGVEAVTTILGGLETDRFFDLSGDGRRLAYIRAPFHSNLWTVDVRQEGDPATLETTQLTTGTSLIERPRVSPDGLSMVFNVGREPRTDLYTMPLAGGTPTRLTFLEALNVAGGWSADGRRIAFASTQDGRPRVWVVDAAGGVPRAVSSGALSDSLDVSWSPGSRILYQQAGNRNYHELDPDAGEETLLTGKDPPGWVFSPAYSPDGRQVAVLWNRRPHRGIWIIDLADRHATLVHETDPGVGRPIGWSADGRHIYVLEGRNAIYRGPVLSFVGETMTGAKILKVPVGGGAARTAVTLPFDEIGSVSMTPDGRRFVCTVYSSSSDVWIVDDFDAPADTRMVMR